MLGCMTDVYGKKIKIKKEEGFSCDRSLNSSKFMNVTGFQPKPWKALNETMRGYSLELVEKLNK